MGAFMRRHRGVVRESVKSDGAKSRTKARCKFETKRHNAFAAKEHRMIARRRLLGLATGALALPALGRGAFAQAYPSRPVKIFVPVGAGGANDTATRLIAQKISESLGQQFYVENLVGAGGNIAMGTAARAAPDGYTAISVATSFVINCSLYARVSYDPVMDFAPVSLMCSTATLVAVHPDLPAKSLKELVALTKANPGKYTYASAGTGTPAHLAGELFKHAYGLDITHVPFTGGNPAMTSTIGGHTPIIFPALSTAAPYVKAGTLRAIAVMSARRSNLLPDVPTMAEEGASNQEADVIVGLLLPAGTARSVIELLNGEIVKALARPEVRERLAVLGFDPVGSTPEAFSNWIKAEIPKWKTVIGGANLRIQ
jgi:tripartite-type tricarboxylate transporter receptor subunit TctC